MGVASISKAQSIREFNHKNHYDKWQFIYDPTMDRGGLITTPAQPPCRWRLRCNRIRTVSHRAKSIFLWVVRDAGIRDIRLFHGPQSPPPAQPTPQQ